MSDEQRQGACIFRRIARGALRAHVVFSNDDAMALLDTAPIRPGHVQIIPRAHFPCFDDLPTPLALAITILGQRIARAQKAALGVERVAFLYTGGDIAHAHAHLVPMVERTSITSKRSIREKEVTFRRPPLAEESALRGVATELRGALMSRSRHRTVRLTQRAMAEPR